jgi:hypothetical protein
MKTELMMKTEIREKYSGIPERQVRPGLNIHTIGRKYITLINTWEGSRLERWEIMEFYHEFM